jgi:hypothetical protein
MDSGDFVEQLTTAEMYDMDVGNDLSTTNDQDFSIDPFKACDV